MKERTQFNYAQRWKIEHSSQKRASKKRNRGFSALAFVFVLVIAILASPWGLQIVLEKNRDKIEQSILKYNEVAIALQDIEGLKIEVGKLERFLIEAAENTKDPKSVLMEIRKLVPIGTTVTSYSLQTDNSVQIGLELSGPIDVAKLWISFRDSGLFLDFDLMSVSLTDDKKNLSLALKLKQ